MCTIQGYCSFREGRCDLTSNEDCKKTRGCRQVGTCTFVADAGKNRMEKLGGCIVGGPEDCKASETCRDRRNCVYKAGLCTK
jgi:hypothetical protein